MERKEIEKKLNKKFGFKIIGWLTNGFDKVFESNYMTEKISQNKAFEILRNFLNKQNMKELIFFPDSTVGWHEYDSRIKKSNDPMTFETVDEAMKSLEYQIFYGAENYYVTNKNIDWILTICHEEDFHISGSKKFVDEFKQKYLS